MKKIVLRVENLRKNYPTNTLPFGCRVMTGVLDDVSFLICEDEFVGLIGESGCGKSTLCRHLAKLEQPTSGKIFFESVDIHANIKRFNKIFRKGCQLVFQNAFASLDPALDVNSILNEPLKNHFNYSKNERTEKILCMLAKLGLDRYNLDKHPNQLSGGRCQKIALCRALLIEPKILICDEIMSNLDDSSQEMVLNLLTEMNERYGMSVLMASHDVSIVKGTFTRILSMENGRIGK